MSSVCSKATHNHITPDAGFFLDAAPVVFHFSDLKRTQLSMLKVNGRAPPAVMQWNNGNGGYGENDGFEDAFRNWRDKATDAFGNLRDKATDAFGGQSGSQGPNSQRGGPPQGSNSQWGGPNPRNRRHFGTINY